MRHRFFCEDDLIKIGWGSESSVDEWNAILAQALRLLDKSEGRLHIMLDLSDLYDIPEDIFHPAIAARLAGHPRAGCLLLISRNPLFVHFVNAHWITQSDEPIGMRAFLEVTDALSWLRGRTL